MIPLNWTVLEAIPKSNAKVCASPVTAATPGTGNDGTVTVSGGILNDGGQETGYNSIVPDFDTTSKYNSIQFGVPKVGDYFYDDISEFIGTVMVNLKEFYLLQDILILELETRDFYVDIAGRTTGTDIPSVVYEIVHFASNNEYTQSVLYTETEHQMEVGDVFDFWNYNDDYLGEFTVHEANSPTILVVQDERLYPFTTGRLVYKKPLFIQDAKTIMSDILKNELLYEGDIEAAPDIQEDWTYAFSLTEQKEAKQIFEGLFKSSLLIPSFNSAGQFKFIGIKQIIEDYTDVEFINTEDVVKYSFSLTKLDDIYNIVNVKYKKDFGADEFDKETGYIIKDNTGSEYDGYESLTTDGLGYSGDSAYNLSYYGLSPEDAKLEVESEYIRDEYTAQKLQKRLLMWYCNQHLITKIDLPPHYMHLEAGDNIAFTDLIGGKLAFGYDYTVSEQRNGQLIYPAFFITKVSKSLTKVSIEAIQVHRGEVGLSDSDASSYILDDPYGLEIYAGDDVALAEEKFSIKWAQFKNNISMGSITAILDTEIEGSFDYTIWITSISEDFRFAGQEFLAGDYEVGEISALDLVGHSKSENRNGMGGLVTISKLAEIQNPLLELTFNLEITLDDHVANNEFFQTYVTPTKPVLGDVNEDGMINILDIVQIVVAIQNDQEDNLPSQADINGDGIYNVQDIILLVNYIFEGGWAEEIIIDDPEDDDDTEGDQGGAG